MTLINRRQFSLATALAPLSVTDAFAQSGKRPDLTIAVADLPATLEPARELSNVGTRITYSIFDTLIRRDFFGKSDGGGSELKPHLAVSWERVSSSELIVRLRQGVKFHNGDELTSQDVAFTFGRGRMYGDKPLIPGAQPYFSILDNCEIVDRYTVRFKTRVPDVLLEQRLASWCAWIVNKRAYEEMGFDAYSRKPVATGPYKVVSHNSNDATILEAFEEYWMGKPTATRVSFRKIPELAARVAGLVAGDYDMITNVPPDQMQTISNYKDIEIRSVVLANSHVLIFDSRDNVLADKRIRQALSLSIDRQKLVDTLWLGKAFVPNSHNYSEYGQMYLQGHAYKYDPTRAKDLLREAGYTGQPIVYRTQANYYTNAMEAAQIMVEMWNSVGIKAELQVVENSTQMRGKGSQISNWSNSTRLPDPLGALWIAWGPGGEIQADPNGSMWVNAQAFNELGKKLEAETDASKRKDLFEQLLTIWDDEAPGTILYQPLEAYAIRKSIAWRPTTFYFMDLRPDNLKFNA